VSARIGGFRPQRVERDQHTVCEFGERKLAPGYSSADRPRNHSQERCRRGHVEVASATNVYAARLPALIYDPYGVPLETLVAELSRDRRLRFGENVEFDPSQGWVFGRYGAAKFLGISERTIPLRAASGAGGHRRFQDQPAVVPIPSPLLNRCGHITSSQHGGWPPVVALAACVSGSGGGRFLADTAIF
jgi:hypothetical protein